MRRLNNKRGTTLIEIMIVIAILAIMLGIAMPNVISESHELKLAELNDSARSVAVAAQSKLYGMKNSSALSSGTAEGSSFDLLVKKATVLTDINLVTNRTDESGNPIEKKFCYLANFKCNEKYTDENVAAAKEMLLSGAITDLDLLDNFILIIFDPDTGFVFEAFYSESPFDADEIVNCQTVSEAFLEDNFIGYYLGEDAPAPEMRRAMPRFDCTFKYDDEMYLQIDMRSLPSSDMENLPLGLEIYAMLPQKNGASGYDELLLYAEGIFATQYNTDTKAGNIKADTPLTFKDIIDAKSIYDDKSKGSLRFALDTYVMDRAGNFKSNLRHQNQPEEITAASVMLYPREPVANWFNKDVNPYLTFGSKTGRNKGTNDYLEDGKKVTDIVGVQQNIMLRVKLYPLDKTKTVETTNGKVYSRDEEYGMIDITSQSRSPYFYYQSDIDGTLLNENSIAISSLRDLNNLSYVFTTTNDITDIKLANDISGQQFYDKLVKVRYAMILAGLDTWDYANWNSVTAATLTVADGQLTVADGQKIITNEDGTTQNKNITFSGKRPENQGGGSFSISNIGAQNVSYSGGLFDYAKNCKFEDIDIINPRSWRNVFNKNFIDVGDNKIKLSLNSWDAVTVGALVGIAVNCEFDNVRAYIDGNQSMKTELTDNQNLVKNLINEKHHSYEEIFADEATAAKDSVSDDDQIFTDKHTSLQSPSVSFMAGVIVGGVVGVAIGEKGTTKFDSCMASSRLGLQMYDAMSNCVYVGGLVGIAMGDVTIENSYASSQICGYYAGGLVGATANGSWSFWSNPTGAVYGNPNGTVKIENSFAAGRIERQVRVGGGLIAQVIDKTTGKLNVTNCYSAVNWDALSPVAYGTFEGDKTEGDNANYYLVPTGVDVPITSNVLAQFSCEGGDVFSLNSTTKCGIGCSASTLKTKFSDAKWGNQTYTMQWKALNADFPTYRSADDTEKEGDKDFRSQSIAYPFPMPSVNTEFWGSWIDTDNLSDIEGKKYGNGYYENETDIEKNDASSHIKFDGYYLAYFNDIDGAQCRFIGDAFITLKKITVEGDTVKIAGTALPDQSSEKLTYKEKYWWALQDRKVAFGEDIAGATDITVEDGKIVFSAAKFYDSSFNPVTANVDVDGVNFVPTGTDINLKSATLSWDYYGFYYCARFGTGDNRTKYYIEYDNTCTGNNATLEDSGESLGYIHINGETFKKAIGYESISLSTKNVEIKWNDDHFQVANK